MSLDRDLEYFGHRQLENEGACRLESPEAARPADPREAEPKCTECHGKGHYPDTVGREPGESCNYCDGTGIAQAPESQPHTVHPWDALRVAAEAVCEEAKDLLGDVSMVPTKKLSALLAAVEKLPLGVRQ